MEKYRDLVASEQDTKELVEYLSGGDNYIENKTASSMSDEELKIINSALSSALETTRPVGGMQKVASFQGQVQNPYPSPFINLSDTKMPRSTAEIFKWCKYYYMFDPLISGAVNALATFPITEVYLEDIEQTGKDGKEKADQSDQLKFFERMFDDLKLTELLVGLGIDYNLYGNVIVFGEMCQDSVTGYYKWKNITRLDPGKILIDYNPVTKEKKYRWIVPENIAKICRDKKPREEYDKIPQILRDAVTTKKSVLLNSKNVYHIPRIADSSGDNVVWGIPVIANVMKLLMYRTTLRQAQEAIAREHIVPMRIFYLQKTESYNPNADWSNVAASLASEIQKSVRDPNHKVVSPIPIGLQNVGGEGRALLLTSEIEQVQNEILAGMNVPREFVFGGVSYSGSSIALKILENNFITYRLRVGDFLQNFLIKPVAELNGWYKDGEDTSMLVKARMIDMKMQDDVQQKQIVLDLNARGKVPDEQVWSMMGFDADKTRKALQEEATSKINNDFEIQKLQAEKQFELQKMQIQQQMELQKLQMELQAKYGTPSQGQDGQTMPQGQDGQTMPQGQDGQTMPQGAEGQTPPQGAEGQTPPQGQDGFSEEELVNAARHIMNLPKRQQQAMLSKIPQQTQEAVANIMHQLESEGQQKVDMRPMPNILPPRRDSLK